MTASNKKWRKPDARTPSKRGGRAGKYPKQKAEPLAIPGRRAIEELLRRNITPELLLVAKRSHSHKEDALFAKCRAAGWKIEEREKSDLDQIAEDLPHQSYIAYISEFPYLKLHELILHIDDIENPIIVALDQIQDVGNLGAILRTAECAGVSAILLPEHHAASITAASIRRSAGAALHLPICKVMNLSKTLDVLIEKGFRVIGADQEGDRSIYQTDMLGSLITVIGSEGRGLRPGIKRRCDVLMAIPLKGRIESLNASAAAAVCLYEALRQRSN